MILAEPRQLADQELFARLDDADGAQLIVRVGAILVIVALLNEAYTTPDDQTVLTAFSICLRLETMVLFVGMGWGAAAAGAVFAAPWAGIELRWKRET